MSGEIWALLSAATWAVDSILVRKGTKFSNASTAAFVSFLVSVLFLVPFIFLRFPSEKIFHSANLYFVASGVIQPAMVRVLFYMGIIRLGVSRAGPLRGTAPLFTMVLAFFILSERPGLLVYAGAVLTVLGTWLVSYRREGEAKWRTIDILFPLGAALLASVSQNIRKLGLLTVDEPLIASTVSSATSFLCLLISLTVSGQLGSLKFRGGCLPYYGVAAVFALVGQLLNFHALHAGEVSVVSPILNTTPLFIIIFTAIFLRGEEKITRLVVIGSIMLVVGIGVITAR
jgi:uncharacterized membrane protein